MVAFVVQAVAIVAWLVILGRVLMGWIDPTYTRPLGRFLFSITEPFLAPIRRALPETGMLDLSPLVVLLVLSVLLRVVLFL